MSYGKIYKITNLINGKCYIGQTTKHDINLRFEEHYKETRNNRHISNAINKYGKNNFLIELISEANNQQELNELEVKYVIEFNTIHPNGYNHRAGGKQNGICSNELKKKISKAKTGKPVLKRRGEIRSEEQKLKISRSLGGKSVLATNIKTGETLLLKTVTEGKKYGFNPSLIVAVCKGNEGRTQHKGYSFDYISEDANQSGSKETKASLHAQRIGSELKLSA